MDTKVIGAGKEAVRSRDFHCALKGMDFQLLTGMNCHVPLSFSFLFFLGSLSLLDMFNIILSGLKEVKEEQLPL